MPFVWETPIGYLLASSIETLQAFTVGALHVCNFSLFFGVCLILMSFCRDLHQNLSGLKEAVAESVNIHKTMSCVDRLKLKAKFIKIQFHSDVKQLSATYLLPFLAFWKSERVISKTVFISVCEGRRL